jgi:serine palmitoyltransferase
MSRAKKDVINFASADFLDFGSAPEVMKATEMALDKYGVGSCGPRGFYGTIDAHVKLEEAIAQFFEKPEAIIYSDGASTTCSAIPAFANRADLLVVDDGCNDNVFTGVRLSRARLIRFKHNDMDDLERVMKQIQQEDVRLNRKPSSQRRFVVFEGLYRNSGDIAPLPELLSLKMKYKWRLIADESLSFGVLGKTGKGITEHFSDKLSPAELQDAVEILIGSLETTLASVGGFCVGSQEVVEHQRLNGAGYCFSASAPPFTCTAAQAALELLAQEKKGQQKLKELKQKCKAFADMFKNSNQFALISAPESPVVHLRLKKTFKSHMDEITALRSIANSALEDDGLLVIPTYYPDVPQTTEPRNTLRLYLHVEHTDAELKRTFDVLTKRAAKV